MNRWDVVIVGEGFAGLTAAAACAQAGLATATLEAAMYGGLVNSINTLLGWSAGDGDDDQVSGIDLATDRISAAADAGTLSHPERALSLQAIDGGWAVLTDAGRHEARAVIVASGASRRPLGLPEEERFAQRGLSHCADCDGPLVKDAEVVVVGGGDSALQEAAVLSHYARVVHIVHRGSTFRARPAVRAAFDAAFAGRAEALRIHWLSTVAALHGSAGVEAVDIVHADGTRAQIAARAIFPCVGLVPNAGWTGLALDAAGAIPVDESCATALPGVFAIGAVRTRHGGTLADAQRDACTAVASILAAQGAKR